MRLSLENQVTGSRAMLVDRVRKCKEDERMKYKVDRKSNGLCILHFKIDTFYKDI